MNAWKPGDVAMVTYRAGRKTREMCLRSIMNDGWMPDDGGHIADDATEDVHPLAVIDPEDSEDRERLAAALVAAVCTQGSDWDGMIAYEIHSHIRDALREFANPTPPKPPEPQGKYAVVIDTAGDEWLRTAESGPDCWLRSGYFTAEKWTSYADIDAVKVLSEGCSE